MPRSLRSSSLIRLLVLGVVGWSGACAPDGKDDTASVDSGGGDSADTADTDSGVTDTGDTDSGDTDTGDTETGPPCTEYADLDGDGFGDPAAVVCDGVSDASDCDDTDADVYPGAPEICDGVANDCDGDGIMDAGGVCTFSLDDATTCRLYGMTPDQAAGNSAHGGDFDGDGTPDLFAFSYGPAFVVSGAEALANEQLDLETVGVPFTSDLAGEGWYPWYTADGIPDVDGDGRDEFIIGDPAANSGTGEAWIVRGLPEGGALTDVAAARLYATSRTWPDLGFDVATIGDTDGDGVVELIVGAPYEDDQNGRAWVVDADVTGDVDLASDAAATFSTDLQWAFAGISVAAAGDVDGDGLQDVLVGGSDAEVALSREGVAWLVRGPLDGRIDLADAEATMRGGKTDAMYGLGLAGLGDTDGDGLDDFAVGASANARAGWVDVWSGTVRGEVEAGEALGRVQGASGDGVGTSVVGPGDIDGDGLSDLALAAPNFNENGATFVWQHGLTGMAAVGDADVTILTETHWGGASVAAAGDVNGDGVPDLMVGTYRDSTRVSEGGSASLVLGGVW